MAKWILGLVSLVLMLTLAAGACGQTDTSPTLTIDSGRSEELVGPIIDQFSASTGIKAEVLYGGT